jgi:hypothetical protein
MAVVVGLGLLLLVILLVAITGLLLWCVYEVLKLRRRRCPCPVPGPTGPTGPEAVDEDDDVDDAPQNAPLKSKSTLTFDLAAVTTGPAGPAGPVGPKGEKGLNGEKGLDGEKGLNGADGARGSTGPCGANGAGSVSQISWVSGPLANAMYLRPGGEPTQVEQLGSLVMVHTGTTMCMVVDLDGAASSSKNPEHGWIFHLIQNGDITAVLTVPVLGENEATMACSDIPFDAGDRFAVHVEAVGMTANVDLHASVSLSYVSTT